ncbi:hypothetical protein DPMN_146569 [Dreissena polymorpha]|uniref:Uncharacterized protein n=1 Tax=Dreissena polymorpha TaxID=45954 RepID=A0A9D4F857_DREPO|nr:hypothetical protein DPMN_146569 [Dreissena polymorpha]
MIEKFKTTDNSPKLLRDALHTTEKQSPRFIPVCYRRSTGENQDDSYKLFNAVTIFPGAASSRSTQDWLRATVVAGYAPRPEPRLTKTPPALTGAIPALDAINATATPRFNPGRSR